MEKEITGIPKWGYYMDHFPVYLFMCSILNGIRTWR
jgi:hypothetical protein